MIAATSLSAAGAVVVGVDASPAARRAVGWAAREASLDGRRLLLVHATGGRTDPWTTWTPVTSGARRREAIQAPLEAIRRGTALVDAARRQVAVQCPGLPTDVLVESQAPFPELLLLSDEAELMVVGSRRPGHHTVADGDLGVRLAAHADSPVVVVPDVDPAVVRLGVLVATDLAEGTGPEVRFALEEAARRGLPLTVVHIGRGRHAAHTVDEHDWLAAEVAGPAEEFPGVGVCVRALPTRRTDRLLRLAARMDLLVVAGLREHRFAPGSAGWVASHLVSRVACPVVSVR